MSNTKVEIHCGDSRRILKSFSDGYFSLIVTSPPYADARQKHYESIKPKDYAEFLISFHEEFWRVLADDGSFVLNVKDKVVDGVRNRYVWQTIMALAEKGWHCIDDYIWLKPNAMPGFWPTRLRDEWEYCFHLTKQKKFRMYQDAVRKPMGAWAEKRLAKLTGKSAERHNSENNSGFGRDLRKWKDKKYVLPGNALSVPLAEELPGNIVSLPLVGKDMGHPAVFPVGLPSFFIRLFTVASDYVLDPFAGSGSTGVAAIELGRNAVLIDSKKEYVKVMENRIADGMKLSKKKH
jgi:DNA modification methylase